MNRELLSLSSGEEGKGCKLGAIRVTGEVVAVPPAASPGP
jgi:hypothetical protein